MALRLRSSICGSVFKIILTAVIQTTKWHHENVVIYSMAPATHTKMNRNKQVYVDRKDS